MYFRITVRSQKPLFYIAWMMSSVALRSSPLLRNTLKFYCHGMTMSPPKSLLIEIEPAEPSLKAASFVR